MRGVENQSDPGAIGSYSLLVKPPNRSLFGLNIRFVLYTLQPVTAILWASGPTINSRVVAASARRSLPWEFSSDRRVGKPKGVGRVTKQLVSALCAWQGQADQPALA